MKKHSEVGQKKRTCFPLFPETGRLGSGRNYREKRSVVLVPFRGRHSFMSGAYNAVGNVSLWKSKFA